MKPLEVMPIDQVSWRERVRVQGRVRSMRVQPWADVATLECVCFDDTGGLVVVFLGRKHVAGISLGRWMQCEGTVGSHRGYLAMLNPVYDLLPPASGA